MRRRLLALTVAVLLAPGVGAAAEQPWRFELSPGVWAAGVNGRARMAGVDIDFLRSLVAVTPDNAVGAAAGFAAGRGPLGLRLDAFWGSGGFAARGSRPPVSALIDGRLDLEVRLAQALGSWRVGEWGSPGGRTARLDFFAGARYGHITAEFEQRGALFGFRVFRDFEWLDPVAGAAAAVELGGGWRCTARGDADWLAVLGAGTRASWAAEAFLERDLSAALGVRGGWRHQVAFAPSGLSDELEITLSGPEAGIAFRF